jgi:hypothetical protein
MIFHIPVIYFFTLKNVVSPCGQQNATHIDPSSLHGHQTHLAACRQGVKILTTFWLCKFVA